MSTKKADRIPPDGELLEFARNNKTGCVHILCWTPESDWVPLTRKDGGDAALLLNALLAPTRMLCGVKLLTGGFDELPATWIAGDDFADDDLCFPCVMALGAQQWRAFHADNRGSPDMTAAASLIWKRPVI